MSESISIASCPSSVVGVSDKDKAIRPDEVLNVQLIEKKDEKLKQTEEFISYSSHHHQHLHNNNNNNQELNQWYI